jgi:hypothetical protein
MQWLSYKYVNRHGNENGGGWRKCQWRLMRLRQTWLSAEMLKAYLKACQSYTTISPLKLFNDSQKCHTEMLMWRILQKYVQYQWRKQYFLQLISLACIIEAESCPYWRVAWPEEIYTIAYNTQREGVLKAVAILYHQSAYNESVIINGENDNTMAGNDQRINGSRKYGYNAMANLA